MREEIMAVQKEIEELKEQSLAMELLKDSKKANKRICCSFSIVVGIMIIVYFVTITIFLNYIKNIDVEETITTTNTQEISDVDTIENSNIVNGDFNGYDKANKYNN